MSDVLFTKNPAVLFSNGNFANFSINTRADIANTLARVIIYGFSFMAAYSNKPLLLLYGLVVLAVVAIVYYIAPDQPPMNTYYQKPKLTATRLVHDLTKGPSQSEQMGKFRADLLTNVRERNFYMGGATGAQSASEYMLGGTRPMAPNRDDSLRNQQFFNDVSNQVWYNNKVPSGDWF